MTFPTLGQVTANCRRHDNCGWGPLTHEVIICTEKHILASYSTDAVEYPETDEDNEAIARMIAASLNATDKLKELGCDPITVAKILPQLMQLAIDISQTTEESANKSELAIWSDSFEHFAGISQTLVQAARTESKPNIVVVVEVEYSACAMCGEDIDIKGCKPGDTVTCKACGEKSTVIITSNDEDGSISKWLI